MKIQTLVIALLAALSLAITGCGKGSEGAVLARVNRASITTADLKRQLEDLSPQMQQAVATDPKARKEFLEDLIGIEVVLQEAKRQGLDKDAEFKRKQETLKKDMEKRIQEETRNELFNSLLKKELMSKLTPPTDQEVKEYYLKNKEDIKKATGKDLTLKQAEEKGLKNYVFQKKQRDAYLDYAKALKARAKITVDEKALDAALASLSQPAVKDAPQLKAPPARDKEEK